jgi:class 3 adenylate cyclase
MTAQTPNTPPEGSRPPRGPGAGDRRVVSILFADIAGSTDIVQRMDPEDALVQAFLSVPVLRDVQSNQF